jgi:nucleotide-binding universal stress UspA family protein
MTPLEPSDRKPFKTLLVPTDFSKGAEHALGRALDLPLARGARLHVIHVLPADLPTKVRAKSEARARASLARALSRARGMAKPIGELDLTSEVLRGQAFVEIIRCARRLDAELVVLGRHGRRPVRNMSIGTTAARVIREGDIPALIVGRKPTRSYRRPLVATDLEDASRRTFQLALRVLGRNVKTIDVVHACCVPFAGFVMPTLTAQDRKNYRRSFEQAAIAGLEASLKPYRDAGVRFKGTVRLGDARSVVLAEARRRRADVVAVGTHGRSGVAHALLGSVAEWIIAAASCDVLVARPTRFSFALP